MASIFEIKKANRNVFIGDLIDLKMAMINTDFDDSTDTASSFENLRKQQFATPRYFLGNYTMSILKENEGETNSMIVIHHENVDPNMIMKKLVEIQDNFGNELASAGGSEDKISSFEWMSSPVAPEIEDYYQYLASCPASLNGSDIDACGVCQNAIKKLNTAGFVVEKSQVNFLRQFYTGK